MVSTERRFGFGENWHKFLFQVTEDRILEAQQSLEDLLKPLVLRGKTFLDVGSGSGLFSLAALRLGAATVRSFDYDQESVASTAALKRVFAPDAQAWTIERGDVLDRSYICRMGQYDVVYSWGVLHHTGAMWKALENVLVAVGERGLLYIALYNDQGLMSSYWKGVKWLYNSMPRLVQRGLEVGFFAFFAVEFFIADVVRMRNPFQRYTGHGRRGMSVYRDVVDWIGGYPFEVASPQAIVGFMKSHGMELKVAKTCGRRHGCNEFVFHRI